MAPPPKKPYGSDLKAVRSKAPRPSRGSGPKGIKAVAGTRVTKAQERRALAGVATKTPRKRSTKAKAQQGTVIDDTGWQQILAAAKRLDGLEVHVGVLASKGGAEKHGEGSDLTLIELMAIHEFGSPEANIPERKPIRTTFERKDRQFTDVCAKATRAMFGGMDPVRAVEIVGLWSASEVKKTITDEEHLPPPLQPATVARKGSDRPLVDTGRLVNAITYEVTKNGEVIR